MITSISSYPILLVSILARPEGRALLAYAITAAAEAWFQSSPAPKDGRYVPRHHRAPSTSVFQSSPAPKDGRYRLRSTHSPQVQEFQSSPAPKDGRYSTTSPRPENNCFSLSFREPIGNSFRLIRNNMIPFIQVIET